MDKRVYTFEDVDLHSESPKAYHCEIGESLFWVPKSQIREFDIDLDRLVTTRWWAEISGAQEAYEEYRERQYADEARRRQQQNAESQRQSTIDLRSAASVYRKLALKYHPDKNPDSAEVMRDLNELWQAITGALKNKR